ncbi:uncharacterized protein N0V89_011601 [Didymosphaeria variabile]|uniref:Xylanolytic transcriptional activator regulatory domain-containing protein n=1 Tax=Didymosphaeria variabile TaxID=1932322 RepID=A0A9W8XA25_9PLEO|nr:uncharacterized protein N0V89_011601 [Didymosphaeria variabile]KAJ4345470.1 hypothetical protein N0V89_011601 [Didymosphaeria variabile]
MGSNFPAIQIANRAVAPDLSTGTSLVYSLLRTLPNDTGPLRASQLSPRTDRHHFYGLETMHDVLFRHCKGHAQNALNRLSNNQQNQQIQQQQQQSGIAANDKQPAESGPTSERTPQLAQDPSLSPLSRQKSSQQQPQPREGPQNSQQSPSLHVRHSSVQQHTSPGESRLEALLNAAQHLGTPADVPWRSPSPINLPTDNERFLTRQPDNMPPPIDPAIDMLSFSPQGHVSSLDQWAFELVQSNHPLPNRTPADALQTWLFPLENDILASNNSHHMTIDSHFDNDFFRNGGDNHGSPSGSSVSIASRIPKERFARVESCWPLRSRTPSRLMPTLWQSLVSCDCSNILSEIPSGVIETPISERERRNSRWGLDEECRDLLQGALNDAPQANTRRSESYGDTASSGGEAGASPSGIENVNVRFPPAEILDIALEMYLYYFHPTLPIIHIPTFSAKNAPRSLLLSMCLIGLSILGTAGAAKFVSRTYPVVLQMVSAELQSLSTSNHTAQSQMRILATGLLALNLASITGVSRNVAKGESIAKREQRKSRIAQAEKLYSDLITAAQKHGLFSANESAPPDSFLEDILDIDARWKAWCRVECAKRIIFGLLEVDCWYAAYLSASPMIRPESVQILPPSEYNLYHANSPTKWFNLVQRGARINSNRITPSYLPTPGLKLDSGTLRSLLTLFLLRVYEANDRLANINGPQKHIEPWRIYSEDPRSRELIPLLVNFSSSSIDALRTADLNSAVLWHSACMMLGANMRYFELAAGRAGSGPAVAALEDISAWSQTPSARRSVLHAAHIFKLLFDRKVSDIVNPHSVVALFQAALVLGLYIFTLPPTSTCGINDNCIELLDIIDWTHVGQVGLIDSPHSPSASLGFGDASLVNFIRNGGPFSITGIALEGGYLAARRTLLHCADLMDGVGRWKSRTFSQILHIMSDDLTEMDGDSDDA